MACMFTGKDPAYDATVNIRLAHLARSTGESTMITDVENENMSEPEQPTGAIRAMASRTVGLVGVSATPPLYSLM